MIVVAKAINTTTSQGTIPTPTRTALALPMPNAPTPHPTNFEMIAAIKINADRNNVRP